MNHGRKRSEIAGMTMPMSVASAIAVSGMNAATLRMQVSASNVANALTDGPLPGSANAGNYPSAYAPQRVDQVATIGGGTSATVSAVSPSYIATYDPSAAYANGSGMVASPNVNFASEFVQQTLAYYNFEANARVVKTDAQMMAKLINITV
jgi:flagellar basal-body rod protein FlgC